ncbi:MAG: bifunctional glutamate N-acetyltransferase/amino-acid acetyltransferase ArgJ [Patulibacter sp.]
MPDAESPVSETPSSAPGSDGFFRSRWVSVPDAVVGVASRGLPRGFRAAGVAAGIKASGQPDVALLVCDAPDAVSAARFTTSSVASAPVVLTRDEGRTDGLRAVVITSGNANAGTGRGGLVAARRVRADAAAAVDLPEDRIAVCGTGVIGVPLPVDVVAAGLGTAAEELSPAGDDDFRRGIETTDLFPKVASLTVRLSGGEVTLHAVAKGAGMIEPRFATMLCFVTTDARLDAATADRLLGAGVAGSFDRISVDGQLSTSDTAVLIASGASGVAVDPGTADERAFAAALHALLDQLALLIVADGEGARRVGRVTVRGGRPADREAVARQVANSPLVKTALYGGDPNWGRIAQAVGAAVPGPRSVPFAIRIAGVEVCRDAEEVPFDRAALVAAVQAPEVDYEIDLAPARADESPAVVHFSDLGHEYVTVNAEYTT